MKIEMYLTEIKSRGWVHDNNDDMYYTSQEERFRITKGEVIIKIKFIIIGKSF